MATPKLENYLRTYRKRSGLTQRDVAFLVGCRNGAQVSRYEKRRRLPPLRTALVYEAAFGVPVSVLFAALREDFRPAVVVAKEPPSRKKVNRARTRKVLELVRHKASLRGIRTRVFKRRAASKLFGGEERLTKHKIATALAERFAELRPVLPPKRKFYESEDYRTSIFDAAALGVAYFDRQKNATPTVPPEHHLPS